MPSPGLRWHLVDTSRPPSGCPLHGSRLCILVHLQTCLHERPGAGQGRGHWGFELNLTPLIAVQGSQLPYPLPHSISIPIYSQLNSQSNLVKQKSDYAILLLEAYSPPPRPHPAFKAKAGILTVVLAMGLARPS